MFLRVMVMSWPSEKGDKNNERFKISPENVLGRDKPNIAILFFAAGAPLIA